MYIFRCEQQLSFSLLERLPLTGRSKQGMVGGAAVVDISIKR